MGLILDRKSVSTLTLIILLLCSMVFGALASYLWVMASYYKMPEETAMLLVKDAVFPSSDARYFNVTILNPSNSVSDVNVTAIRLTLEGKNETYDITEEMTEPSLPFLIKRGTEQTFKCKRNWSDFAGEAVKIEPIAENVLKTIYTYSPPNVKLKVTPNFEEQVYQSIECFNLTIQNLQPEPLINLTISEITVHGSTINTTPPLPQVLMPNQAETFMCERNWEDLKWVNVTIIVKTVEGYEAVHVTNELPGAALYIDEIMFDYADTSYFNLTISSSEYSTSDAVITKVNLTLANEPPITLNTTPPLHILPITIGPNQTLPPIRCLWNWGMHRNETFTISVYTKQGFTVPSKNFTTPTEVVWNITNVKFDFDSMEFFTVNVTNMPCSLHGINITNVLFNEENTTIVSPLTYVLPEEEITLNCSFPWLNWINKTVTITVVTEEGQSISRSVEIPAVELKLLGDNFVFGDLKDQYPNLTISIPYVNITISNSMQSIQNVTINKIVLETGNKTYEIDGSLTYPRLSPNGYVLNAGENITIMCLWGWDIHLGLEPIKVTVYTAEGFQISRTWYPS
ncbi:MAG: hypothetical protein ACUVT9_03185 [Candidatus Bathycorpusculaceae bacterium]